MNSSANSTDTRFIDAYRFQVDTMQANTIISTGWNVFIPGIPLSISDDGRVYQRNGHCDPSLVLKVENSYMERCQAEKRQPDYVELDRLLAQAGEEAKEKIQIPLALVEKMNSYLNERKILEEKQKELNASIKILAQSIINS